MATNTNTKQQSTDKDCGCDEKDNATQKSITLQRRVYCDKLYETAGEVSKAEKNKNGEVILFERKKCMFLWTEENYRRYRNTELCIGTELIQSGDLIKENVTNYVKWGNDLSTTLKNIFKSVKEVKSKMKDLREAACKLESCMNDSCNCTQMIILTGVTPEGCKDEGKGDEHKNSKEGCEHAGTYLNEIVCMAKKGLSFDADSLFKASSEIIGIQVFSNIGTLDPLQKKFGERAKDFEKLLMEIVKTREGDLKKIQEDLTKSVVETTKAYSKLYGKRSDFEGAHRMLDYVCCPECGCVDECDDVCDPRLKKCECKICDICEDVQKTFCREDCEEEEPVAAQ